MLKFQCRQPNRTTVARTLNLALFLGHPIVAMRDFRIPADVLIDVPSSGVLEQRRLMGSRRRAGKTRRSGLWRSRNVGY